MRRVGYVLALLAATAHGGDLDLEVEVPWQFDELVRIVEAGLGSPFPRPVKVEWCTKVQRPSMVTSEDPSLRERMEARKSLFSKLRFSDPPHAPSVSLLAWYDNRKCRVCLVEDPITKVPSMLQNVLLHELTHAHRHTSGLYEKTGGDPLGPERDRWLAGRCLVEGDAVLMAFLFGLARRDLKDSMAYGKWLNDHRIAANRHGRRIQTHVEDWARLDTDRATPYREGVAFCLHVFRQQGPAGLDRSFRNPPRSTEQILHPERYLAEHPDEPTRFFNPELPDTVTSRWPMIDRGTLGEYDFGFMFKELLGAERARRAAAGWDGSFYQLRRQPGEERCLLTMITVWDTEDDAGEFALAWCEWAGRRDKGPYSIATKPTAAGEMRRLETKDGSVLVVRRGRDVAVIDGLRGLDPVPILLALWKSPRLDPSG